MCNELYHYGIKGMRWGVRRFQNKNGTLTNAGKSRYSDIQYHRNSGKKIITNKDGSKTIPSGFMFNRVGKSTIDVNESGGLYVSYGKEDASRYIKNLGPTPMNKLFGTKADTVQHISVKKNLKMPSDEQVAIETAKLLNSDKKLFQSFKKSLYSMSVTDNFEESVSDVHIQKALKNPSGKEGQKLAYGVSSFLADPNFSNESKVVYKHFRDKGYDAIPDVHDVLSGTSKTAMIIINSDKVEVKTTTLITKDVMKAAKQYVKEIGKLKTSELIE